MSKGIYAIADHVGDRPGRAKRQVSVDQAHADWIPWSEGPGVARRLDGAPRARHRLEPACGERPRHEIGGVPAKAADQEWRGDGLQQRPDLGARPALDRLPAEA